MFRRTRPALSEVAPRRIVLIKPSALGDVIHALPVLTALRRRYADAHLAWVVNSAYAPLLQGHPDLDEVIPFDRGAMRRGWGTAFRAIRQLTGTLRRQPFDLAIDLQGLLRSGLMTLATGAPRRVGLSSAREGAGWAYTDTIHVDGTQDLHAVDRYWRVASALGAGNEAKVFRLPSFASEEPWVEETVRLCPRPWMGVGVGARWLTKRWPPAHFAALLGKAQQEFGGTAFFLGGREDTALALSALQDLRGKGVMLTGQTTLPQLAGLLKRMDLVLTNDTGPLHLAVALGRPVVAPYTCTRVRLTGPYGSAATAVETKVDCAGSLLKTCPHMRCMRELTPDRLWPILREVLQTWQIVTRPSRSA